MERWQSLYEHEVELNLADSAVRCAPLGMLLGADGLDELAGLELFYPEVNGSELLRGLDRRRCTSRRLRRTRCS